MRSSARECVYKYIFSKLFNPDDEGLFDVLTKELNEKDKQFANDLLKAVEDNQERYMEEIDNISIGYKITRIHKTDMCALLIGMAELENFKDTDVPVVIDQAVSLVAKFSTENSTDFVNGILARYAKEI